MVGRMLNRYGVDASHVRKSQKVYNDDTGQTVVSDEALAKVKLFEDTHKTNTSKANNLIKNDEVILLVDGKDVQLQDTLSTTRHIYIVTAVTEHKGRKEKDLLLEVVATRTNV